MESMEAHFKEFDKRKNKITCDNTVNLKCNEWIMKLSSRRARADS